MHSPRVVLTSLVWLVWVGLVACGGNGGGGPPPVVLRSIAITPTTPTVAAGTSVQLTATGMYSDATTMDLSAMVTWSSSATATATVSATGLLQGLKVGGTTITATLGAVSGTANAAVTAALLTAIEVTPTNQSLALGITQQFIAMGVFSDATKQDLTAQVTWVSDADHVSVTATGLATAVSIGSATIRATKGTISGTTMVMATPAVLASIAITPPAPSVARGRTLQLTATGTFSDTTTQDLTSQVTWASATPANATISASGLVQGANVGTSMITATLGAVTGSTLLTVTAAVLESISVTPPGPSVAKGRTQQFTATGTFSDTTTQDLTAQVTWASSDATIAQVSNAAGSQGLAQTLRVGATTVTATLGPVSGSTALTVTAAVLDAIGVTPTNPSVAKGRRLQLTATGTFSDATTQDLTTQVTWASSAATVAQVSNAPGSQGLATALDVGLTTVTATLGPVSGATALTVTAAALESIAVTPTSPSLPAGRTLAFTATGTFSDTTIQDLTTQVTWASTDTAIATISNAAGSQGLATAVKVGTTTISATLGTVSGSTTLTVTAAVLDSIQVTPVAPSVSAGRTQQFIATGTFSDATTQNLTTQVTWASSDPTVATISNAAGSQGIAATLTPGTTTISATLGAVTGSTTLTVTDAVLVSIQLAPVNPKVALGRTQQFFATGTFSDTTTQDLTTQVTWVSADETIATISNAAGSQGLATTLGVGASQISATLDGITGSTALTVTPAALESIAVTPVDASVAKGRSQQFTAIGTFSDRTTQGLTTQVTWSSSNPAVAQISNAAGSQGLATTLGVGPTTISATLAGVTGSTSLTVTAAVLDAIAVTPADPSIAKGRSQQFTAIGTFSDATTQDLTTQVTWASADITVAQISNAAGSAGLATTLAVGTTTISATLTGVTGATSLTVTAAVLDSITVAPATASVIPGGKQQFTATANFSDATTLDVTATATWASGDPAIAQVSNAAGSQGLATGILVGSTAITATSGSVTGTAAITVVGPSVSSTAPPDAAIDVRTSTTIVVTFNEAIDPASLTTQTTAGACSGSLQLSADNFASCVGFTAAAPVMSAANTVATATPSPKLATQTTYRIRVLGTVTNAGGSPIGTDFTQATGFTTAGTCAPRMVVSQVYGGGGNNGSVFRNDFIELHNVGAAPADLTGLAVQFISAANTGTWAVQALPSVTVAPGGYFLIQEAQGANLTALLPTPDFVPTTPVAGGVAGFAIGATSGKVAITPSTTPLTGATCSTVLGATIDLVGFGASLSCFEGSAGAGAPANATSVQRNEGGCDDSNDNRADFTVATPVPRNSATVTNQCSCAGNVTTGDPAGVSASEVSELDDGSSFVSLP